MSEANVSLMLANYYMNSDDEGTVQIYQVILAFAIIIVKKSLKPFEIFLYKANNKIIHCAERQILKLLIFLGS